MAVLEGFSTQNSQGEEVTIAINFNDPGNHRITSMTWVNSQGGRDAIRARVWDNGQLVYDNVETSRNGQRNIPGNIQAVDDGAGGWRLPDGIEYALEVL